MALPFRQKAMVKRYRLNPLPSTEKDLYIHIVFPNNSDIYFFGFKQKWKQTLSESNFSACYCSAGSKLLKHITMQVLSVLLNVMKYSFPPALYISWENCYKFRIFKQTQDSNPKQLIIHIKIYVAFFFPFVVDFSCICQINGEKL